MNSFLNSVRADLMGVRLRLVVILLAIGLLASVGYVVLGGKKSAAPGAVAPSTSASVTGITVSQAPISPNLVVAETTSGTSHQRRGAPRNPFTPLPGAGATGATGSTGASAAGSSTAGSSSSSGSGTSTSSSGGATPVAAPKPSPPTKTKTTVHYHVTAQFGVIPAASAPALPSEPAKPPAILKTYTDMSLDEPLPDKSNPQLVFLGVVLHTGKDAVFALGGEAILHGNAACLPSATQCQAIQLQVGQTETLESIEPNGTPVTYELKLVSILKSITSATTSSAESNTHAHTALSPALEAGREQLRRKGGVAALSGLQYSRTPGVLVFAGNPVSVAARARASARRGHHGH
jgi:hypothetical protein